MSQLRTLRNYINGEFRDAADGRTTDVVNPATGEVYATAPLSAAADVDAALAAAEAAFPGWRDTIPAERQKALLKIADAVEARRLSRRAAAVVLVRQTVAARLFDARLQADHLEFCAELSRRLPVLSLRFPRHLDALPAMTEAIAALPGA